jgi:hypothetical protein
LPGGPQLIAKVYPYVGKYPFIPLLQSCEWPVQKIWRLTKLHDHTVKSLRPIFLHNLQDLNNKINEHDTLRAAFFTMEYKEQNDSEHMTYSQVLIESIHNTGNPNTKVVLVPPKHYHSAISQLTAVHSGLQAYIDPSFHDKVSIQGTEVCLAGQKADSISSCTYTAHIYPLLGKFQPTG